MTSTTPIFQNITYSNIYGTTISGHPVGIIWAKTELPATNIVFDRINLTGYQNFCLYNVSGAQFIDSKINLPAGTATFELFNTQAIITNSAPTSTLFSFDGLTTNGYGNGFALYNAPGSLQNTNVLDDGPLTLSASTFTVNNNLTLFPSTVLSFGLGNNAATLAVGGNLALGGTLNVTNGPGFGAGTYTLLTYAGALSGSLPALGSIPAGYNYSIDTTHAGLVNLDVSSTVSAAPVSIVCQVVGEQLQLSWPSDHIGWQLQMQMNGLGTNWVDVAGSTATNVFPITISPANASVYYRLVYP